MQMINLQSDDLKNLKLNSYIYEKFAFVENMETLKNLKYLLTYCNSIIFP